MTQPVGQTRNLLTSALRVTLVALCTVSFVFLLGAVPVQPDVVKKTVKPLAVAVVAAPASTATSNALPDEVIAAIPTSLAFTVTPEVAAAPEAPATPRVIKMEVTAYCPCTKCCGPKAQGITASGKHVSYNGGKFVAADTKVLPFGRQLVIPGYAGGERVEVVDRGGAIKGYKLDLYFATHAEALQWGRQTLDVTVYE
jgi:3D (Asp-Asp-Asp) domain-containing protein